MAVVLDVLFATSTIINAFAAGATEVIPTLDEAGAHAEAQKHPDGSYVLAGELYAVTLPGFAPPTPLALTEHGLEWDGEVVYQSKRRPLHDRALQRLADAGDTFYCRCTRRDLKGKSRMHRITEHIFDSRKYPKQVLKLLNGDGLGFL